MSDDKSPLSKSRFVQGEQCEKLLWTRYYAKERIAPTTPAQQYIFDQGNEIGDLACQLFPYGIEIKNTFQYQEMMKQTLAHIAQGYKNIFEATFLYNGMLVMVDILHQRDDGAWEIYEVKSSTSVKGVYITDAAYQTMVLKHCGFEIDKAYIIHVNNSYIRQGDLDIHQLFTIVDVTEEVFAREPQIAQQATAFTALIASQSEPTIPIGEHCFYPYECPARTHCWSHVPSPSAFDLVDLVKEERFPADLAGIERTSLFSGYAFHQIDPKQLNYRQKRQFDVHKSGQPYKNAQKISEIIPQNLEDYHILKLHFTSNGIPQYDGYKPFENTPYGFTLATYTNGLQTAIQHFLADPATDTRTQVNDALMPLIADKKKIVVYHNSFEIGAARKIASLDEARLVNLAKIFTNLHYYDSSFLSDFSLQSVIGHFDAGLKAQMEGLAIKNDAEAQYGFRFVNKTSLATDLVEYGNHHIESVHISLLSSL